MDTNSQVLTVHIYVYCGERKEEGKEGEGGKEGRREEGKEGGDDKGKGHQLKKE